MRTFVAASLALLISTPSFGFTYPGALCKQANSGGDPDTDSNGHAENGSTSNSLDLICPLVVDLPTNSGSLLTDVFYTDFTDVVNTGEVCCEARAKSLSSSSLWLGSQACSSDTGQSSSSANYSLLVPVVPSLDASRYLFCTLPANDTVGGGRSEIRGYRFNE
jgi:hypothetical protein